jgi:hypothetical protein
MYYHKYALLIPGKFQNKNTLSIPSAGTWNSCISTLQPISESLLREKVEYPDALSRLFIEFYHSMGP